MSTDDKHRGPNISMEELLGSTGIEAPNQPMTLEEQGYRQARPKKKLKVPENTLKYGRYSGESETETASRWMKNQTRIFNHKQKQVTRIESFIDLDDKGQPWLYVCFTKLKPKVIKANPLHTAILGSRSAAGRDRIGISGKESDKAFLSLLCQGNRHPDGRPNWESYFCKKGHLVVRFPISKGFYSTIPLYEVPE